ncbi:MAG: potassium transporter Kup [FCB group bacterium]|jgi:KUP system potassium uptake protein|nr:potassium transporter Kup [FCB group bacterium]
MCAAKVKSTAAVEGTVASVPPHAPEAKKLNTKALGLLTLGALGVVYGDIGTSPLYALKECFNPEHGVSPTLGNVLGVLSLVFWALILVISVKYMVFVLRANNRGEGGILALMSLALSDREQESTTLRKALVIMGLFGAALLYGDGMITPAISVLSAVEGLELDPHTLKLGHIAEAAPSALAPYVIPITIAVLIGLFLVQRHGTARIGAVFGPIILLWFTALAAAGIRGILMEPSVFRAINPLYALEFFRANGFLGFTVLGFVFLVVTGGEALYADMGHFGRHPIQLGWFAVALPALLLNYFGQGAILLNEPRAAEHPFYWLTPSWALYPMIALATCATIIASQAVISGAFSVTRQAVQLGYLPRVPIVHTSSAEIGQIYIPLVNTILLICTIGLVLGFKTSSNLAAAYGIAVTATMFITTILLYVVARHVWHWRLLPALLMAAAFLIVDLAFFGAALTKLFQGGWFPLAIGLAAYLMMSTWRKGRQLLGERLRERILSLEGFVQSIKLSPPHRVAGAAVFMSGNPDGTPPVLLHNLKHNKVLHQTVVFLTITTEEIPHVPQEDRIELRDLGEGFYKVKAHYGFMESPSIPDILALCKAHDLTLHMMQTTFFLGRETLVPTRKRTMPAWRERLFAFMSRNAQTATAFFEIPPGQVVELGVRVEL